LSSIHSSFIQNLALFWLYLVLIYQFRFDITLIELNQLFIHSKSGIVLVVFSINLPVQV